MAAPAPKRDALATALLTVQLLKLARDPPHRLNPKAVDDLAGRLVRDGTIELTPEGRVRPMSRESWGDFIAYLWARTGPGQDVRWAFNREGEHTTDAGAERPPGPPKPSPLSGMTASQKLEFANARAEATGRQNPKPKEFP